MNNQHLKIDLKGMNVHHKFIYVSEFLCCHYSVHLHLINIRKQKITLKNLEKERSKYKGYLNIIPEKNLVKKSIRYFSWHINNFIVDLVETDLDISIIPLNPIKWLYLFTSKWKIIWIPRVLLKVKDKKAKIESKCLFFFF